MGLPVGASLGLSVGDLDGRAVGASVGTRVGATVHVEHSSSEQPKPSLQRHLLYEHCSLPQRHMPLVLSHRSHSARVQPPWAVGTAVGFAVVGAFVGSLVGGAVGASVGHESVVRISSADASEPNDVVTYGMEAGIPEESVSSVPTLTSVPTPTGISRSVLDLIASM